ncbi:MAG: hypothetical protein Cons2KO_07600 [Congregibacter sp.]
MTFANWFAAILALGLVGTPASAQQPDLRGVTIATTHVAANVYMLEASGDVAGNIAVSIGDDGVLIVDDQWAGLAPQIFAALAELHSGELKFILNTHHHEDHADGNATMAARHHPVIVAHDKARTRLQQEGRSAEALPVITFNEDLSIHFNKDQVRAIAVPGGHTDNDSVIFFETANVVHMGDLFNAGIASFPIADLEAGGNAYQILENVERISKLIPEDAKIIPGHGPLSDKAGLLAMRDMLSETIRLVQDRKAAGMTLPEIQAAGLPATYDAWGYGYTSADDWIANIYHSPVIHSPANHSPVNHSPVNHSPLNQSPASASSASNMDTSERGAENTRE